MHVWMMFVREFDRHAICFNNISLYLSLSRSPFFRQFSGPELHGRSRNPNDVKANREECALLSHTTHAFKTQFNFFLVFSVIAPECLAMKLMKFLRENLVLNKNYHMMQLENGFVPRSLRPAPPRRRRSRSMVLENVEAPRSHERRRMWSKEIASESGRHVMSVRAFPRIAITQFIML